MRFESHVAHTTTSKVPAKQPALPATSQLVQEQYHGLIGEKLRMIKSKSELPQQPVSMPQQPVSMQQPASMQQPPAPPHSYVHASQNSQQPPANALYSTSHPPQYPTTPYGNGTTPLDLSQQLHLNPTPLPLTPQEISQLTSRLFQLHTQFPQIDKLIALHTRLNTAPDTLKKLVNCRNMLVNQFDMMSQKKLLFLNMNQLNFLTEQIQKLSVHLNTRVKETAGGGKQASAPHSNASGNMNVNTTMNQNAKPIPAPMTHSHPFAAGGFSNKSGPSVATTNGNVHAQASRSQPSSANGSPTASHVSVSNSSASSDQSAVPAATLAKTRPSVGAFEKQLSQRLMALEDDPCPPSALSRYICAVSTAEQPAAMTLRHVKRRDAMLMSELSLLRNEGYRIHQQDAPHGTVSILVLNPPLATRFLFRVSPVYPFDQLLYTVETEGASMTAPMTALLPVNCEPRCHPQTISTILRNHHFLHQHSPS